MVTPEQLTKRYEELGLPVTMPQEQQDAWKAYLAGQGAPLRLLPKNGGTCYAESMGGPYCGYALLIDGSCPGRSDHRDVVEADLDGDDE